MRFNRVNTGFSVLRWGPTSSQQVFQRARLCQTSRSRVHSLPETGAVWLSSCYWLLFLWRAGFCQVNFFPLPCQLSEHRLYRSAHASTSRSWPELATPNSHLSCCGERSGIREQRTALYMLGAKWINDTKTCTTSSCEMFGFWTVNSHRLRDRFATERERGKWFAKKFGRSLELNLVL